jgi:hypothetical protein
MNASPMRRSNLSLAKGVAAALAVLAGSSALAQDIRIDVTGSNIKRIEGEGALPVTDKARARSSSGRQPNGWDDLADG